MTNDQNLPEATKLEDILGPTNIEDLVVSDFNIAWTMLDGTPIHKHTKKGTAVASLRFVITNKRTKRKANAGFSKQADIQYANQHMAKFMLNDLVRNALHQLTNVLVGKASVPDAFSIE